MVVGIGMQTLSNKSIFLVVKTPKFRCIGKINSSSSIANVAPMVPSYDLVNQAPTNETFDASKY